WHADDRLLAWSAAAPGLRVYTGAPWRPERARGRFGIKRALWLSRDRLIYAPFADGLYIASASDHTRRPQPLPTAAGKAAGVFVDADAPDSGAWALLVHSDGGLWNLDGTPDMPVARRLQDFGGVRRLAVAGRGRHVALLHSDHITVHKWPRRTLVSRFAVSGRDTFGIDLDARGTLLAAGLRDGSVRVWRTSSGKRVAELRGHDVRVADVDFHAGTGLLLSASWDGSVRLWDVPTLTAPTAPIARRVRASWGLNMTQALARLHPL
ncbi:MAG: hypothetical protein KC502_19930, partial [Myxococcales bacterium]|nr:hypothetical protein [Myxococcales bacterium]